LTRAPMPPVRFHSERDLSRALDLILRQLRQHRLIAYPTETVYGIGGPVTETGISLLRALKGRATSKPFLMLVSGPPMLDGTSLRLNDSARSLAAVFWPGPLTLILDDPSLMHPLMHDGNRNAVAVRMTSHPMLQQLIAAYGAPITSSSANMEGENAGTSGDAITTMFPDACIAGTLLVLDAGALPPSLPSTVVDCTSEPPRLVRPGAVSVAELQSVVPRITEPE
jgi:L-threonylcarbamoyladenylate synthase